MFARVVVERVAAVGALRGHREQGDTRQTKAPPTMPASAVWYGEASQAGRPRPVRRVRRSSGSSRNAPVASANATVNSADQRNTGVAGPFRNRPSGVSTTRSGYWREMSVTAGPYQSTNPGAVSRTRPHQLLVGGRAAPKASTATTASTAVATARRWRNESSPPEVGATVRSSTATATRNTPIAPAAARAARRAASPLRQANRRGASAAMAMPAAIASRWAGQVAERAVGSGRGRAADRRDRQSVDPRQRDQ